MIDFELAAMKAFTEEFPTCKVNGCLFHLSQNISKKIQEKGLMTRYRADEEFSLQVRMLMS